MAELVARASAIDGLIQRPVGCQLIIEKTLSKSFSLTACMIAPDDYQSYLQEICCRYKQWWTENALTEAIAARQATFSFEQMVQAEEKDSEGKPKRITLPIFNAVENYIKSEHILLVGSPGVGKSTALLRCLFLLAEREREKPEPRLPVLVSMKKYKVSFSNSEDPSGMLTLIRSALPPKIRRKVSVSEVEELLLDNQLILLLDGLNEMPAESIRTHLKAFREECQDSQVPLICTTRELGGGDLGIKRKLQIQPLRSEEVERFLQDCIPDQKQKVLQLLNRDNRGLSRTPFVLWMLYDLFQQQGTEVESLADAFRQFFQSFKKYKEDAPVSDERRQEWNRWLEHLAFTMLNSPDPTDPGLVISQEQAEKSLIEKFGNLYGASSRIEELLKYHLLEPISGKEISFHHQLIQEYYAAECLLTQLPDLLKKQPEQQYAPFQMNYLNHVKWTEAIALMLGFPEVADQQALQIVNLALAEKNQLAGAKLAGAVKQTLHSQTIKLINDLEIPLLVKIRLLGLTQSKRSIPYLSMIINSQDMDFQVHTAAIDAIGDIGGQEAINCLAQSLENVDSTLRFCIFSVLGRISEAYAIPSTNIETYISSNVRAQILQQQNSIPLSQLIQELEDEKAETRFRAALFLGRRGDKTAIPALRVKLYDSDWQVIQSAITALGKIAGVETLHDLYKLLSSDSLDANLTHEITTAIAAIQSRCGFYNHEIYQHSQKLEDKDDFIDQFYKNIDKAIDQIKKNPELRQEDKEDRLTIEIIGLLCSYGYNASHDTKIGGHVDIAVEKNNLIWLGEAKIYKDNNYLWEGFQQLATRYSIGGSNQSSGGLLIYIFDKDAKSVMDKWQAYLLSKQLPDYNCRPCESGSLAFISSHKHQRSGLPFHVKHIPVSLHFSPQDRSGRRSSRTK